MKTPSAGHIEILEDGYLDPTSTRKRELAELFGKKDGVEKLSISSNTIGNKYHGDDGKFVGSVVAASSNKISTKVTSDILGYGTTEVSASINKDTGQAQVDARTQLTHEELRERDTTMYSYLAMAGLVVDALVSAKAAGIAKVSLTVNIQDKDGKTGLTWSHPPLSIEGPEVEAAMKTIGPNMKFV